MTLVASGDGGLVSEFALSGGSVLPLVVLMVAAAFEGECHPVSGTGHQPLATMKTGLRTKRKHFLRALILCGRD